MAAFQNLVFTLGETWVFEVDCEDIDGEPLSLDGGSLRVRVWSPAQKLMDFSSPGPNVQVIDTPNGKVLITINPSDQVAAGVVADASYKWDAQVTLADGTVSDQVRGFLTLRDAPPS